MPYLSIAFVAVMLIQSFNLTRLAHSAEVFDFHHENVLGTSFKLRVLAESEPDAQQAESRILNEIDRQVAIFSTYASDSELLRWLKAPNQLHQASDELLTVMSASDEWRVKSHGAFNPSIQILSQLWSDSAKRGHRPLKGALAAAVLQTNQPVWQIDPASRTVTRLNDNPVTFNAIAKGFIVDSCCDVGFDSTRGIHGLLVSIGGDLRACGTVDELIGITNPRLTAANSPPIAIVPLRNRALATSGNYRRGFQISGRWYSHIIDPRTGESVDHVLSASVIAPRAMDADALATIMNVLTPEESLKLAAELPEIECLLITRDGQTLRSSGWPDAQVPLAQFAFADNAEQAEKPKAADQPQWNGGMELEVKFEINQPGGGRYHRPYVAVWIEDKDDFAVRTLVLWMARNGQRWLRDLRRWSKTDATRQLLDGTDLARTISGATRQPGKYEALWNGKDDAGKLVKPGEYTIYIEAAREHGTYQLIRKKITIGDKPF